MSTPWLDFPIKSIEAMHRLTHLEDETEAGIADVQNILLKTVCYKNVKKQEGVCVDE
jgi:hypothetical protein